MLVKNLLSFVFVGLASTQMAVASIDADTIYDGHRVEPQSLDSVIEKIQPGTVVVLSEYHDSVDHHKKQALFLHRLAEAGFNVSVGMEFIGYPFKKQVDDFLASKITEDEFLKAILWPGNPFEFYRELVLFPAHHSGRTLGLNAPQWLSRKISQGGFESLTPEEKEFMPPNFEMGNDLYYERFKEAVGGHGAAADDEIKAEVAINEEPFDDGIKLHSQMVKHSKNEDDRLYRYFMAQSLWDDTMAWQASSYINENPDQVLVIIVGDFHNVYGGGLPDRLVARGVQQLLTISQTRLFDDSKADNFAKVAPHPRYGNRADYVWVSE